MKNNRSYTAQNPGAIAAQLFGSQKIESPAPHPYPEMFAGQIIAVYPTITHDLHRQIMDRYRLYREDYNARCIVANLEMENHNAAVEAFLASDQANDTHKAYAAFFEEKVKREQRANARKYTPWEYNAMVTEVCAQHGPILKLVKAHKIIYSTEMYFSTFLYMYNSQLAYKNYQRKNAKNTKPMPLPAFKANGHRVTQQTRNDGTLSVSHCTKTAENHRKRLEEAGIFIHGQYKGSKTSYEVQFNPEILTVYDLFSSRFAGAENQPSAPKRWKELRKCPSDNGSILKDKVENMGNPAEFPDKVSAVPTAFTLLGHRDRDTALCNVENSPGAAAPESVKIEKNVSDVLIHTLKSANKLDAELSGGQHDYYQPIDLQVLKREAHTGSLTPEQFREVFFQDFLKYTAKLYRGRPVRAGSWCNALKILRAERFITFKGQVHDKLTIFNHIEEYRWRIDKAFAWFAKSNYDPLFPSLYFDVTRKKSIEMGFEYTLNFWINKQNQPKRDALKAKKRKEAAAAREPFCKNALKFKRKLQAYEKGTIDFFKLADYVEKYLPVEFKGKLAAHLQLIEAKKNLKKYRA